MTNPSRLHYFFDMDSLCPCASATLRAKTMKPVVLWRHWLSFRTPIAGIARDLRRVCGPEVPAHRLSREAYGVRAACCRFGSLIGARHGQRVARTSYASRGSFAARLLEEGSRPIPVNSRQFSPFRGISRYFPVKKCSLLMPEANPTFCRLNQLVKSVYVRHLGQRSPF
jgi:hypothetical protein